MIIRAQAGSPGTIGVPVVLPVVMGYQNGIEYVVLTQRFVLVQT